MRLERGWRASLALTLNFVAFAFALSAVTTSYWCEGTRKVAKPFCTGPPVKVKQWFCIRFNSSNINDSRLVQYIFETGEEKFLMRKFHTGIFFSCEQAADMNGKTLLVNVLGRKWCWVKKRHSRLSLIVKTSTFPDEISDFKLVGVQLHKTRNKRRFWQIIRCLGARPVHVCQYYASTSTARKTKQDYKLFVTCANRSSHLAWQALKVSLHEDSHPALRFKLYCADRDHCYVKVSQEYKYPVGTLGVVATWLVDIVQ